MTDDAVPGVLFEPAEDHGDDATRWVATSYARGPWHPDHCHGGAPSALLARAVERVGLGADGGREDGVDWHVARLTTELARPVPVGVPLTLTTELERPGRKVSIVGATLVADDRVVALTRAVRIRRDDLELPPHDAPPGEFLRGPAESPVRTSSWASGAADGIAYHLSSNEFRFDVGSWEQRGPARVWIRLAVAVVPGEEPSGVQRVAAAADFGNGMSSPLEADEVTYINPDLTVHLARPPAGEWIGLAARSVFGDGRRSIGVGLAESALHDTGGWFGRSVQSLILQQS